MTTRITTATPTQIEQSVVVVVIVVEVLLLVVMVEGKRIVHISRVGMGGGMVVVVLVTVVGLVGGKIIM